MGDRYYDKARKNLSRDTKTNKAPNPERDVDAATEELMQVIDEHHLCSSDVPQSQTLDLLRALRSAIDMRIETIRQEMANG